eukprot:scaffold888_cov569-Prasinococcus_capsulatus_cf.AAC.4
MLKRSRRPRPAFEKGQAIASNNPLLRLHSSREPAWGFHVLVKAWRGTRARIYGSGRARMRRAGLPLAHVESPAAARAPLVVPPRPAAR